MRIAIVTDSTAYLSQEDRSTGNIHVVPVEVIVNGRPFQEGVDITPTQVAEALEKWKVITTSRPSPVEFERTYQQLAADGATGIVSVHLSSIMSGTYQSAVLAAQQSPVPVTVVDSQTIAGGLAFAVRAASAAARRGADLTEVASIAADTAAASRVLFYVDTLEYLRRGGRMGAGAAMVGTALRVKPILQIQDGKVEPLEKARTANKALQRLADIVVDIADQRPMLVSIQHLAAVERAEQLAEMLRSKITVEQLSIGEVGAVVGAHVGPGMVSVSLVPA